MRLQSFLETLRINNLETIKILKTEQAIERIRLKDYENRTSIAS